MNSRPALACAMILSSAGLIAQSGRETYRQIYETWRQTQINLERDAGTGGAAVIAQADRAGAAEESFKATRAAYLKSAAEDAAQRRQILQTAAFRPSPDLAPPSLPGLVAGELQIVTRTVARFATDKDRGIQQLRQSLERERDALTALNDSIQVRQKTVAAMAVSVATLEQARVQAAAAFAEEASQHAQVLEQMEKEGPAWADYYEKLTQAIEMANAPPPPPPVSSPPATPRPSSISSVSLPRYVGAWTYPMVNGIFHGAQPEFVDLVVHEQNGHADGMLFARFKVVTGNTTDPLVRFDFQGDFNPSGTQRFALVTSDGAQGFLELIPGPAFNLLEVNFQTDPKPNKIRTGNFILVKK